MSKIMLIDATHDEETRVAVVEGRRLAEFDYESKFRKPLKGSIFLAKVTRVEPSLQAAFVNFGGNRHGFLPFTEIHPDYFRIPIADREALLAEQQAILEAQAKEEEQREEEFADEKDGGGAQEKSEEEDNVEYLERDDDAVEEIGGSERKGRAGSRDDSAEEMPEADEPTAAQDTPEFRDDEEDTQSGNMRESEEFPDDDEISGNLKDASEPQEGSDNTDNNGERHHRRGRGGRGRGRGGRGHHGGRDRMQHRSNRSEKYSDEYSAEDRFRFSLRRKYKIQEVIKRGQIMLVQVSKEERGNKGAAVSTYLSLPGRYCVLMPNSPRGGGVSRKIASYKDRARIKDMMKDLEVPQGMSVIVRTAGVSRTKPEVKRDLDYLMRLWDNIRELTLQSSAPSIVYEEADLIKRAVRDLYGKDIEEIIVAGDEGYKTAKNFMKMMIPSHLENVIEYADEKMPLFRRYHVEEQIAEIGEARVTLPSGGYLIINPTEALVSVDVNSGKATKERHIEETALKTNLEAAQEIARQLRLRDLGGLVVIDFIDMEDRRNNAKVERRMRDSLSSDRARIQMSRISSFGLMELSRQRLNPSLTESQFETCHHCGGMGRVRTCDATSIMLLRSMEDEGMKGRSGQVVAHVSNDVATYILNNKRKNLTDIESRYGLSLLIRVDENVGPAGFKLDVDKTAGGRDEAPKDEERDNSKDEELHEEGRSAEAGERDREHRGPGGGSGEEGRGARRRGRRGGRRRGGGRRDNTNAEGGREPRHHGRNADNSERSESPKREPVRSREDHFDQPEPVQVSESQQTSPLIVGPSNDDQRPAPAPKPREQKEYEKINEPPPEKKRGWWNRLTD